MRVFIAAALILVAACTTTGESAAVKNGPTAGEAAAEFLDAFNALDPVRFDAFFAEDATMFFPGGPFPKERVAGKEAVTAAFHRFFEMAKQRGATRLGIQPLDLQVQDHGQFAVVSFHLRGNGNVGRRSIIMRRAPEGWRIVHFHASALEEAK